MRLLGGIGPRWAVTFVLGAAVALAGCSGGGDGQPPSPPTISTQPTAVSVVDGDAARFTVVAASEQTLTYQWERNGTAIAGANTSLYTLPAADISDSGSEFRVVVSNAAGATTSAAATLTVRPAPPAITVQPQSASAPDGGSIGLSVVARGTAPLTYQWRRGDIAVPGATSPILSVDGLAMADTGSTYSVVVSNAAGSVTSPPAIVTVLAVPPTIVQGPAGRQVAVGQSARFEVRASGSTPLTYQWLRDGAAIPGATSPSLDTAASTAADDGARFRAVVSNAAGSTTSAEAVLQVVTTVQPPSVVAQPVPLAVTEGQAASFAVVATGTQPFQYQWQRDGSDLPGATGPSFDLSTTTAADDGARFRVRIANAAGAVTSAEALLTVQRSSSPLAGRLWALGQLLEANDNVVEAADAGIDDLGRVTLVFLKSDGTRLVLYATRGTPNAAGNPAIWSTPVAIDVLNGTPVNNMRSSNFNFRVAVSAGGNAAAQWYRTAPCTTSTYRTTGTCQYMLVARYLASSQQWEPPVEIGDFPDADFELRINDAGDVAMLGDGWVRAGASGFALRKAVVWRAAAAASFRRQLLGDGNLGATGFGLDEGGRMLVAAEIAQNSTTDIVAFRGTQAGGFGAATVLDQRSNAATLDVMDVGRNGQQIVTWRQNDGTSTRRFAATAGAPDAPWAVADFAPMVVTLTDKVMLVVGDDGVGHFHDLYNRKSWRWQSGAWSSERALPTTASLGNDWDCAMARSGDVLCTMTGGFNQRGRWNTYDATRNVMVRATGSASPEDFVLGVDTINRSAGYARPLLSVSGFGFHWLVNGYDTLPSATAPAGDARAISNLWGVFLR